MNLRFLKVSLSFWLVIFANCVFVELGISFSNITQRTVLVLNPIQKEATLDVIQDVDLTGPVIFCLVFGVFLLMVILKKV